MKISCDEATKICDKNQYGEASLLDKIKLNIHLFLCKKCGLYSKQNRILTKCYEANRDTYNTHCLSKKDKKDLEIKIKTRI